MSGWGPDGVYATCERLLGEGVVGLVARMEAYNDNPTVMPAVVRAPVRAGYRLAQDAPVR